MTQPEQVAFTGAGAQTEVEGRWGDHTELTVDPARGAHPPCTRPAEALTCLTE